MELESLQQAVAMMMMLVCNVQVPYLKFLIWGLVILQIVSIECHLALQHYPSEDGQVENAEVEKPKYGNGSMETEVRK